MAKAKAKSKGKRKGKQAKLSKGKKKSRATKSKARKGSAKKKAATRKRKRSAPARRSAPEPVPSFVADTTPVVPTFASDMSQERSMADESPGPEETSYSEINETDNSQSSM
jgi:hypothetical protein